MKLLKNNEVPIFLILISLIFWFNTYSLPLPKYEPLGSAFFPRILIIFIIVLSVVDLCINLLFSKRSNDYSQIIHSKNSKMVIISLALFLLYLIVIYFGSVNFLIVTFLFLIIFIWLLSPKKINLIPTMLMIDAIIILIVYLVFIKYLWISFD